MSVSLPASLRSFVDDRVRKDGYSTSSGNVRELIGADAVRRAERELADLMREALASGLAKPAGKSCRARKRRALGRRCAA